MSHFEKIANFLPDLRRLKFQDGALFGTIWKKRPHVALGNCIYEGNMRPLFWICQNKCPILKFLTPPYFRDMCYFRKIGIHCVIIKCTFIKKIMGLAPILNSFWPNLLASIFWNFQKKIFSAPFWHFSQNYWFYPYFRVKQPYRTKINISPKIWPLQTLKMAHFDLQYQTVKMRP